MVWLRCALTKVVVRCWLRVGGVSYRSVPLQCVLSLGQSAAGHVCVAVQSRSSSRSIDEFSRARTARVAQIGTGSLRPASLLAPEWLVSYRPLGVERNASPQGDQRSLRAPQTDRESNGRSRLPRILQTLESRARQINCSLRRRSAAQVWASPSPSTPSRRSSC